MMLNNALQRTPHCFADQMVSSCCAAENTCRCRFFRQLLPSPKKGFCPLWGR